VLLYRGVRMDHAGRLQAVWSRRIDWRVLSGRNRDRLRGFLKQGGGEAVS
jgi:hypothetical protein